MPEKKIFKIVRGTGDGDNMWAKYTMAVVVTLTGVEAHRIRRYEEAGIIEPKRTEAGQRLFSDEEVFIIREVFRLSVKGINLEGIKAVLALRRGEDV
ncbi:MAG: MerR family transcriptional regulator [Dehalococcoidales bacterium]|nr:MerR family transcriptional regulator [Dehalococcoidales bacterium]